VFNMKVPNSPKTALRDGAIDTPCLTVVGDSLLPLVPDPLGRLYPLFTDKFGPFHSFTFPS
jgi:hypothetical protein